MYTNLNVCFPQHTNVNNNQNNNGNNNKAVFAVVKMRVHFRLYRNVLLH